MAESNTMLGSAGLRGQHYDALRFDRLLAKSDDATPCRVVL